MNKVHKYTRAKVDGKKIFCPSCNTQNLVYHFSWSAITCSSCKKMINKYDWLLEPKKLTLNKYFNEYKSTIMQKIHDAFNPKKDVVWDNEYKPNIKIKSTVKPDGNPSFNDIAQNINKELNKLK